MTLVFLFLLYELIYTETTRSSFQTFQACEDHAISSSHVIGRPSVSTPTECARECSEAYNCVSFAVGGETCNLADVQINTSCMGGNKTESSVGMTVYTNTKRCLNGGYVVNDSCWCVGGFVGENCQNIAEDCAEADLYPYYTDLAIILKIKPKLAETSFPVHCSNTHHPGRTNLLIRAKNDTNFNRDWNSYKHGFGDLSEPWATDIWMGLEHVHTLTKSRSYTLRVSVAGDTWANFFQQFYFNFTVSGEDLNYTMDYTGTAPLTTHPLGDSFTLSKGMPFSTYDKDSTKNNCPVSFGSGWWFSTSSDGNCSYCNPTGILTFSPTLERTGSSKEVFFEHDLGNFAPHRVHIALERDP